MTQDELNKVATEIASRKALETWKEVYGKITPEMMTKDPHIGINILTKTFVVLFVNFILNLQISCVKPENQPGATHEFLELVFDMIQDAVLTNMGIKEN